MTMAVQLPYRMQQVIQVARNDGKQAPVIPDNARDRLTEPMLHQFRLLPVADQFHLLQVYELLVDANADDDTITAGLIHDVGKACAKCRITIVDRALHVILTKVTPALYRRFAAMETAPGIARGLHRLANHAQRGALAAEQAGYSDRVIELIRSHESGGDSGDSQLRLLRRADEQAGHS